jgi:tetratricopeptide (TPR) repeat protein
MMGFKAGGWRWSGIAIAAAILLILAENLGASSLNQLLLYLPGVDKVLHVGQSALIFGALFFCLRPVPVRRSARLAIAVALALCLALFDEWQQRWLGGRTVELADLMAGGAGVLFGAGMALRSQWRTAGQVSVASAVIAASLIAYASYLKTKDFNWGLLAEQRADMVSARRHFQDALSGGMRSAALYNELAWTEVESGVGDASMAVEYAELSLAIRPGDADTLDTYGWALHKAGRSLDALVPLNEALKKDPEMYCIHYHLGATYLDLGQHATARRHLEQQIAVLPGSREALLAGTLLEQLR